MQSTPLVRHILREESVTRGLGDVEARMIVDWLADRAERIADEAPTEAAAWAILRATCRKARAISCFIRLWFEPDSRGAAIQMAAAERAPWPFPSSDMDPGEAMGEILAWTDRNDRLTKDCPALGVRVAA